MYSLIFIRMSKSLVAGMALSAALTAQAQAPKAPVVCTENQTSVVSAVEGVIGCKDVQKKEAYRHVGTPTSGPAEITAESTTPPQNNKNNIEIGGTDGGIAGAITFANGDIGIRLAAEKDKKGEHLLAAMGLWFQNGHAIVGASMGREDIDGFDKKVTAKGVFVQLNMTNL